MLAETRAELEDFQHSSKELEEELEKELEGDDIDETIEERLIPVRKVLAKVSL